MNTTTPPVRVSYPTLFTARAVNPGDDPKFGIVLMFDKTNAEHKECLRKLFADAQAVFNEEWPDPATAPRIPLVGHDKSPIKDGDKALNQQGVPVKEKNPEYAGHFIIRAGTFQRKPVVDRDRAEILDSNAVYGGCFCKVNINPYTYNYPTSKGVTFGLNGVQFWKDDDPFGGARGPTLGDMFEPGNVSSQNGSADDDPFGGGSGRQTGKVGATTVIGPDDEIPF